MTKFHSVFDEPPDLSTADAIRSTLHIAYDRYHELWMERERRPGTSVHACALYGAYTAYYEETGTNPLSVMRMEWVVWLDLLPFVHLPEEVGLDAVIEYILLKEGHMRDEARLGWLLDQIQEGTMNAVMAGEKEQVRQAMDVQDFGALPWVGLVAHRFRI